ncbi:MAG: hypothetical protein ACKV0T_13185 [Planctomycetales bacterium]
MTPEARLGTFHAHRRAVDSHTLERISEKSAYNCRPAGVGGLRRNGMQKKKFYYEATRGVKTQKSLDPYVWNCF